MIAPAGFLALVIAYFENCSKQDGLPGYPAPGERAGEGAAASTEDGADGSGWTDSTGISDS